MHDPLPRIVDVVETQAEFRAMPPHRQDHVARGRETVGGAAGMGGDAMIDRRPGQFRVTHGQAALTQGVEGMPAGGFLHDVAVDGDQRAAVGKCAGDVTVPDLVEQGQGHVVFGRLVVLAGIIAVKSAKAKSSKGTE